MKEFMEYPCEVYTLTHTYKVRKILVVQPRYGASKVCGYSNAVGGIHARDCYPTFAAAAKAGHTRIAKRLKVLKATEQTLLKYQDALTDQVKKEATKPQPKKAKK